MAWPQRYPLVASLAVLAGLLVVVVALEAIFGPDPGAAAKLAAARPASPADSKLLPPVPAVNAEQAYPETTARPIFTPTRRPAPEAVAAAQNTFAPGQFVLQGVIIVGDSRVAMLREKANGRIHRVERGREVNGIKVVEIEPETVKLALGAQTEVLALTVQKGAGAPAAPAAGPFAGTPAPPAPGAAPVPGQPSAPVAAFPPPPSAAPQPATGFPATPAQGASPGQATLPQGTASTPMTPEELLARRRARRALQNQ